ncbi:hypothetical protein SLA2020_311910 [Shorea laevis]
MEGVSVVPRPLLFLGDMTARRVTVTLKGADPGAFLLGTGNGKRSSSYLIAANLRFAVAELPWENAGEVWR